MNGFLNAGGHAFGRYGLFVAIAALPVGIYTFDNASGNGVSIHLGVCSFAWAILWALFSVLLALDRPIGRISGALAGIGGIGTAWVFGPPLRDQISF